MKNKTTNINTTESQIRYDINDVNAVKFIVIQKGKANGPIVPNHPAFGRAGGRFCTGPPGRAPDSGARGDPKHPPKLIGDKNQINTKVQFFNTYLNFKLLQTFNFFIMKKQILFLAFFVLALMGGTLNSFGQALDASSSQVPLLSCADPSATGFVPQPLHPFAGVPYTYSMSSTGATPALSYTWWATKNPNFIPSEGNNNIGDMLDVAAGELIAKGSTYGVTTLVTPGPANTVSITWSPDILAATDYQGDVTAAGTIAAPSPTFVVGYAKGDNCADNIQVFEIAPLPNFVLAVLPIDPADNSTRLPWGDDTGAADLCVDEVQSATYDNINKEITMDYGTNTFYFEVGAANFVKDWTPTFQIGTGLASTQTAVLTVFETLADATGSGTAIWTSNSVAATGMNANITGAAAMPALTATNASDIANGVSVYVKVVIDNNTQESLSNSDFTLLVDALDNSTGALAERNWDMEDIDCTTNTNAADQIDQAVIRVLPRPTLDDTTVDTLTDPDTYILKTP